MLKKRKDRRPWIYGCRARRWRAEIDGDEKTLWRLRDVDKKAVPEIIGSITIKTEYFKVEKAEVFRDKISRWSWFDYNSNRLMVYNYFSSSCCEKAIF